MSNHNQSLSNGLSRRTILLGGAAAAGLASFSSFLTFRANAAPNVGELQLVPSKPNPNGSIDKLFLLKGDPLAAPIKRIVAEDSSAVPSPVLKPGERRVFRVLHLYEMQNHITGIHKKKADTRSFEPMM